MASYKIYFLDFFHQNHPSCAEKCLVALQNASNNPCFMKKVDFALFLRVLQLAAEHGTIAHQLPIK